MPAPVTALAAVIIALAIGGCIVYRIRPRILAVGRSCSHRGPARPYTVAAAHDTMQRLIDCDVATCHDKASAYRVLVAAKVVVPSDKPARHLGLA